MKDDSSKASGKKVYISTTLLLILELIAFYFILKIEYDQRILLTDHNNVTFDNIWLYWLEGIVEMVFIPAILIILTKTSIKSLGFSKKEPILCGILLVTYITCVILKKEYNAGGFYNAVYLLGMIGFGEELLYRGWAYNRLKKENVVWAIMISGFFWGAGHAIYTGIIKDCTIAQIIKMMFFGGGSMNAMGGILVGVYFVALLELSGNLWVPVLVHGCVDHSYEQSGLIVQVGVLLYLGITTYKRRSPI